MIPFHISSEQDRQPLGFLADKCPNCDELRAFFAYRLLHTWKWFEAKLDERVVSQAVVCCLCRMAFALPAATTIQVDTSWQQEEGLQVLVDRTNPALGTVLQRHEPSDQAVLWLLRSLENQHRNFVELPEETSARTVAIGALLCGVAFGLLGNILVSLGPHKDEAWSASVSFTIAPPGLVIAAIIGGIIGGMRIARNETAEDIRGTMRLYNLRCSQLREALAKEPDRLRRVASIVEELCQSNTDVK